MEADRGAFDSLLLSSTGNEHSLRPALERQVHRAPIRLRRRDVRPEAASKKEVHAEESAIKMTEIRDNVETRSSKSVPRSRARSPFPLRLWHWTTARVLYTATVYLLLLYLVRAARETLTLFLFAILFAYFLLPVVNWLQSRVQGRGKAILVTYLLLAALLTLLGFLVGPRVSAEARAFADSLPSLSNRLASGELLSSFGQHHGWSRGRIRQVQDFLVLHKAQILGYGRSLAARLAAPASHLWWLVLIPILTLFFLREGQSMASSVATLATDREDRRVVDGIFADVNVMLGSYIRAQITLAALTLAAYLVVLSLLRVPYAFILSPAAGFLEFVPVVGPAVAAVSVFGIAVLAGYPHAAWLIVFLAVWRLLQDYVNAPRIMGKSLEIEPIVQIFAVLAGGEIGGIIGALVSVPVVAILRIVWRRMHPDTPKLTTSQGETFTGPTTG